eukprot:4895017-Pyramimonas_sp.AAC.1
MGGSEKGTNTGRERHHKIGLGATPSTLLTGFTLENFLSIDGLEGTLEDPHPNGEGHTLNLFHSPSGGLPPGAPARRRRRPGGQPRDCPR